eukprot:365535-Chlamydomonas_euryale.AAC.6
MGPWLTPAICAMICTSSWSRLSTSCRCRTPAACSLSTANSCCSDFSSSRVLLLPPPAAAAAAAPPPPRMCAAALTTSSRRCSPDELPGASSASTALSACARRPSLAVDASPR